MPRPLTCLTANIKVTLDRRLAGAALRDCLTLSEPDIVALQEWGPWRDTELDKIAADYGLDWTRPDGCGPVAWDAARFTLVSARARVLARAGFMGRLPGRKSMLPDSLAALVVLRDSIGRETVVLNVHLTAEVQFGTGYRTDAAHRARVRRHKREVASIAAFVRRQKRRGRTVIVAGDSNFDGLEVPGVVSCWRGRSGGTLGKRAVDIIFAPWPAVAVQRIPTASDHDAVAVTY